ncbi:MAG: hypothetical protein KC613_23560 [Myxococcales bacterium]|nr:hypothetical protein [Myxococcales bacterium]
MPALRRLPPLALILTGLAACAPTASDGEAAGHLDQAAPALTVDHEATLRFQADYNTVAENLPVYAGGRLKISYDPLRLPACRADGWQLFARLTVQGPTPSAPTVQLRANGRLYEAVWAVPEDAQGLTLRFSTVDPQGCTEADDGPGAAGYPAEIRTPSAPAVLSFDARWAEAQDRPIRQGGLMQIAYAPERLPVCRNRAYGGRAWNILAGWRFSPGGQTGQASLFVGSYYDDAAAYTQPVVPVPADATGVELWFSNSDRTGCTGWDSDFGANYRFAVEPAAAAGPAVGWAGDLQFVLVNNQRRPQGDVDPAYYWDRWQGMPQASEVEAQVWIPGLTDRAYPDDGARRAAAAQVFAVAETDAVAGDLAEGWGEHPLAFMGQRGNNFVFAWRLVDLRGPALRVADGLYRYRLAFSTDGGATRTYLTGPEGRDRRVVFAADVACDLFPDHAPEGCAVGRPVQWAGDVGAKRGGACAWRAGIEDPVTFTKSALGSDCMVLTADVYIPGLTDAGGDPRSVWAVAEANLDFHQGPLDDTLNWPMLSDGRVGNNYRYAWNLAELVGRADRADYQYRFKFSADEGRTWSVVGADVDDGWRTLRIRNDSLDVDPVEPDPEDPEVCDGVWRYDGPGNQFPACHPALDAQFDANHCEFYVNALGRGQFSQAQANEQWLEAWISVAPDQDGQVIDVGLFAQWTEDGQAYEGFVLGTLVEPNYWRSGLVTWSNAHGIRREVSAVAFFIDVQRPDGAVERLWHSGGGANYALADVYATPGYRLNIGSGSIEYADEQGALFDAKRACGR